MSDFVLVAEDLSKTYYDAGGKIEILKNIHLKIKPGELVAIVGNSGSGKSTLLHLLGGLDQPTSGSVALAGKNLAHLSEKEKCSLRNTALGFVYQFHHLLPEFTALENVCMPLLIRGMAPVDAEKKGEYLLVAVGLQERLQHKITELSGGERQRVAIARALVTDPLCILADELTGNLDPGNAEKVLQLFITLQREHKTSVVMVTHDAGIASKAARRLVLEGGRLVEASS